MLIASRLLVLRKCRPAARSLAGHSQLSHALVLSCCVFKFATPTISIFHHQASIKPTAVLALEPQALALEMCFRRKLRVYLYVRIRTPTPQVTHVCSTDALLR